MLREFMEFRLPPQLLVCKFCPVKYEINLSQVQYVYIYISATFTSELIYTFIAKTLGTALQHIPRISPLLIEWLVLYPMFVGELCVSSLPSCLGFLCPYSYGPKYQL